MSWAVFDTEKEAQALCDELWLRYLDADETRIKASIEAGAVTLAFAGVDHEGKRAEDGLTLRWAEPRQTLKGQWAVELLPDDKGEAEPQWPELEPLTQDSSPVVGFGTRA